MGPKQLSRIERWNLILAGLFIAVAGLAFPRPVLFGVIVGTVLACANFFAIHKLIQISMAGQGKKRAVVQLLLVAKMGLLIALVFLAMRYLPINAAALAIGLSVFLLSIAIESVRFALGQKASDGRA
jgi:hypothetical protein